jgi:hypothetical protein
VKIKTKSKAQEQREKIRRRFFTGEDAWTGENEKGWFRSPRTLPLLLLLLSSKEISGKKDVTKVYVELWSRHIGEGIIEMKQEAEHAYASGYPGRRGVRSWQERMKILEAHGIIKSVSVSGVTRKYVLLVHPTKFVQGLINAGKVSPEWLNSYHDRQIETKETTHEARKKMRPAQKVVPIGAARAAS